MVCLSRTRKFKRNYYVFFSVNFSEGILLHFTAAMLSGFLTAFNSMPFDIAKTRIQNSPSSAGKAPGVVKVILDISQKEGVRALWKGFIPTYCRIGPHTVLTFIFNEQITRFYKEFFVDT